MLRLIKKIIINKSEEVNGMRIENCGLYKEDIYS